MSDETSKKRKKITTSALMTKSQEAEVIKQMEEIEKAQAEAQAEIMADPNATPSAALRPKVAPWTKSEPLTKIHSILGHIAQGDIYRNDLELVYDRLKGDAQAPEYIPSEKDKQAEDAFEPIIGRGDDPWANDQFAFGESSGSVSFESNQSPVKEAQTDSAKNEILGGFDMNEFDQLHQSAKSSGTLNQDVVDSFLGKSEPVLSDQDLDRLSGVEEATTDDVVEVQENQIDPFAAPADLPKRERGLAEDQEPFFTQNDTFAEMNFDLVDEAGGVHDSKQDDSSSLTNSQSQSPDDLALGEAEDTIVD